MKFVHNLMITLLVFTVSSSSAQIPERDAQKVRDLAKKHGATEEQIKQGEEYLRQLPADERNKIINQFEQMSQEEREELLKRAKEEFSRPGGPLTQHVIVGPDVPSSYVKNYKELRQIGQVGSKDDLLFKTAWDQIIRLVSIRRKKSDGFSDHGVGNGILLTPTALLTARHVATAVSASPSKYELTQVGDYENVIFAPLVFERIEEVRTPASPDGDPDLAILSVKGAKGFSDKKFPIGALPAPQSKGQVVSIGCSEMQLLPSAGTGIVTTRATLRELSEALPLKRTVFGSSLRSFPGLSGAPVLNDDGHLVGIVLGGVKKYAKTGETVTTVEAGQNWETFNDWTWVTPVQQYSKMIDVILAKGDS